MTEARVLADTDAERTVIGSVVSGTPGSLSALSRLRPMDFHDPHRATIFGALTNHLSNGKPIELVAVGATLKDLNRADCLQELATCADRYLTFDPRDVEFLVDRIAALAHQRDIERSVARVPGILRDPDLEYDEKLEAAAAEVFAALAPRRQDRLGTAEALATHELNAIDDRLCGRTLAARPAISTGIDSLDAAIGGLRAGRLVVIAARSSHGKSTLCADVALAAAEGGRSTAYLALEATQREVFLALLQKRTGVRPFEVLEGLVDENTIGPALHAMKGLPLVIESGRFTLKTLAGQIRRARAVRGVELVIVDYVQLVQNSIRGATRSTEVAAVTGELKALALELEICIVVCAQLNKNPDLREGGEPHLSDLRESEAIAHDADQVVFLVRPDLRREGGPPYLVLAKNRHGPGASRIPLSFDPERNRYGSASLRAVA